MALYRPAFKTGLFDEMSVNWHLILPPHAFFFQKEILAWSSSLHHLNQHTEVLPRAHSARFQHGTPCSRFYTWIAFATLKWGQSQGRILESKEKVLAIFPRSQEGHFWTHFWSFGNFCHIRACFCWNVFGHRTIGSTLAFWYCKQASLTQSKRVSAKYKSNPRTQIQVVCRGESLEALKYQHVRWLNW